jgi:RNA polymerase sigma factor (sigma-70 family)
MARRYSDQEVISMLQSTDIRMHNDALKFLHKAYDPMISRYVISNSGSREEAEEILNDVVFTFFKNVRSEKFEPQEAKISTYFYGVAKRKWLTELKKQKARPRATGDMEAWTRADEADDSQFTDYENQELVERLLEKLEPNCRKLIRAFMDGWSMEDIAVMVGFRNAASAKAQKYHCLKRLGKLINPSL